MRRETACFNRRKVDTLDREDFTFPVEVGRGIKEQIFSLARRRMYIWSKNNPTRPSDVLDQTLNISCLLRSGNRKKKEKLASYLSVLNARQRVPYAARFCRSRWYKTIMCAPRCWGKWGRCCPERCSCKARLGCIRGWWPPAKPKSPWSLLTRRPWSEHSTPAIERERAYLVSHWLARLTYEMINVIKYQPNSRLIAIARCKCTCLEQPPTGQYHWSIIMGLCPSFMVMS